MSARARIAAFVLLVAALVTTAAVSSDRSSSAPVPVTGTLGVRDGRIVDRAGREVLMRGFNVFPVWGDQPGRTWGPENYTQIRDHGFNTVRFVLHWSELQPRPGELDPGAIATLDRAIGYARAAGLYVVFDTVHVFNGETFVPAWARRGDVVADVQANAGGYLRALAERYRDEPAVVGYDLVSEPPVDPPDQNTALRMYDGLIRTVREVDAGKLLFFNCVSGDTSMAGADLGLLSDKRNLVFTMYDYYAGGAGAGYLPNGAQDTPGRGGTGVYAYTGAVTYAGTAEELDQHLSVNVDIMRDAGIPVWIGAFGINAEAPNARQWIRDKVAVFKAHGLGYAWWNYGEGADFPTVDSEHHLLPFTDDLR